MTSPREIMAAAIHASDESVGETEIGWPETWDALYQLVKRVYRRRSDAALAALTAAGFEVRRVVEREALRERIEQALDPFVCSTGHLMSVYPGNVVNAVLAVLDTPTEDQP